VLTIILAFQGSHTRRHWAVDSMQKRLTFHSTSHEGDCPSARGTLFSRLASTVHSALMSSEISARNAISTRRVISLRILVAAGIAFNYLLVLRLVPIFPFWLVNLVPALVGMRLRSYMLATFLGIIPATFVFASLGSGLGEIVEEPDLGIIFHRSVLLPIIGLAVLA